MLVFAWRPLRQLIRVGCPLKGGDGLTRLCDCLVEAERCVENPTTLRDTNISQEPKKHMNINY
eukprot:4279194-Amphidinium_carterae.1